MKLITVRQLLREFKSIFPLPDDGLEVMRKEGNFYIYNKAQTMSQYNHVDPVSDIPVESIPKNKEKFGVEYVGDLRSHKIYASTSYDFCEQHFEQGVKYKLYEIVYEDINGDVTLHKKMCKPCMEKVFKQASESGSIRSLEAPVEVPVDKDIAKV